MNNDEPIYTQFRHDANGAIACLMREKHGEAIAALYHPDVGDIDLLWGGEGTGESDGYGVAKLAKFHHEVLGNLQEIILEMKVIQPSGSNRIRLSSESYYAVVRLEWNGIKRNWLLTAFRKEVSGSDTRTDTIATNSKGDTSRLETADGFTLDAINQNVNLPQGVRAMETQVITYNLKDRGRQFRGQERHFNIGQIVNAINSPACQERVKNRDMHGYYGHLTRVKCGMIPNEGMMDGLIPKVVPAFVTTYLKANPDGSIEHKAEFASTDTGLAASKLFQSRMGGFSSAIDERKPEFFGFDYVLEPNFTTNRGYSLDDVNGMTLDAIELAIQDEQMRGMIALLDSVNGERERANEVIERMQAENEQLISMLASKGIEASHVLDAVSVMPISVSTETTRRMQRDSELFRSSVLPQFVEPENPSKADPLYDRLLSHFTR